MSLPATPQLSSREFISPGDEAVVFRRMRRRILTTLAWHTLSQSWFRVALVAVLTTLLWGGMFWMFLDGFGFLNTIIPDRDTHTRTVSAVFGTFFAALMVMLVFSSGIILYGSLFCSKETAFLLTTPAHGTGVSAQVSGSPAAEQLGICAFGKPGSLGLRGRGAAPGITT